jgi:hypothetical protein
MCPERPPPHQETDMIRFFLRFLALLFLVGAVIAAVIDSSRSIAASALSLTSFGEFWGAYSPDSLGAVRNWAPQFLSAQLWAAASNFVLAMPTVAILMVLAVLFYAIGHKRENRYGRFASN